MSKPVFTSPKESPEVSREVIYRGEAFLKLVPLLTQRKTLCSDCGIALTPQTTAQGYGALCTSCAQ